WEKRDPAAAAVRRPLRGPGAAAGATAESRRRGRLRPPRRPSRAETYGAGSSVGAGSETGEHVVAVGRVEIPPGVAYEAAGRCEAAASQNLVRAEPGLRVLLVRVDDE